MFGNRVMGTLQKPEKSSERGTNRSTFRAIAAASAGSVTCPQVSYQSLC